MRCVINRSGQRSMQSIGFAKGGGGFRIYEESEKLNEQAGFKKCEQPGSPNEGAGQKYEGLESPSEESASIM